jgi:hypothetical protein
VDDEKPGAPAWFWDAVDCALAKQAANRAADPAKLTRRRSGIEA